MKDIEDYFTKNIDAINRIDKNLIIQFVDLLLNAYNNKKTIFIFGNGGSAATASHFCGDLIKGVSFGLKKRFKVICLNDNIPAVLAIANDLSYQDVFVEQLKNFLEEGDLVIGISGSGNSMNVVKAIEYANSVGANTVALCGFDGGKIKNIAKLSVHAEINDMEIVEDVHLTVLHCIKQILISLIKELNPEMR